MKRVLLIILVFCFICSGCSREGSNDKEVVAQINDYKMTVNDLRYEFDNVPYDNAELVSTESGRREYLDMLIERELLLQEAQERGIDKEKDFMKSIENYWEQALIKLLLQRKSKEISGSIHVYDDEIKEYYDSSGEILPLSRVRRDIERSIRQDKETEAMSEWINDLKKESCIKVNGELFEKTLTE